MLPQQTPQQKEMFNNQLVNDDDFIEVKDGVDSLQKNQSKIMRMIEENEVENREEFKKGAEKFTKLESDMKKLEDKVDNGFNRVFKGIDSLRAEIKDDKMEKMSKQLEKLQAEKEKKEENVSTLKRNILGATIIAIIGVVVTYIAMTLGITPSK